MKMIGLAHRLETHAGVGAAVFRQNFFGKPYSVFAAKALKPIRPTHMMEGNLLCLKSTDDRCHKITFTATLGLVLE